MTQWTQVTEEVAEALAQHRPVVALETTLVSHGFSGGRGLAAATESERRVREAGATPATVGIIDGAIHVGLTKAELERFAEAGLAARKVGARDLAACLAQGALGATTVGGTLAVCRQLRIRFMGTGGIGGVHRGFADSLDISGDLLQIARTQVAVVASGPKSLLDVAATSELLETLAVPVLGWQTPTLPRFYTAEGGPPVSAVVSDSPEAARICAAHWELDGAGGILLARPPADGIDLGPLIDEAVEEVRGQNLSGQAVTPAVLSIVHERSGGASVTVNRQLIEDNAALAAETAVAYAQRRNAALARRAGRPSVPSQLANVILRCGPLVLVASEAIACTSPTRSRGGNQERTVVSSRLLRVIWRILCFRGSRRDDRCPNAVVEAGPSDLRGDI